jgi:hypothetical protein
LGYAKIKEKYKDRQVLKKRERRRKTMIAHDVKSLCIIFQFFKTERYTLKGAK